MAYDLPFLRLSKKNAVAVVCGLTVLALAADLLTPEDLDCSVFYAFAIAACAWLRSPRYLWVTTGIIALFVAIDLGYEATALRSSTESLWVLLLDRSFDSLALLMLAIVVHLWIRSLQALDANQLVLAKQVDLSRELQHRVGNDLQVIFSFLDRAGRRTGDPEAKRSFEIVGRQVMSMGQIYDHLVGTEMSATIDFTAYLKALCSRVGELRTIQRPGVQLVCRAEDSVFLDLDTVTALGIIVNELIANAYEHGFPDRDGTIEVSLLYQQGDGRADLRIDDDGIGLPESAADSVGLRLVRRWVARIDGTLELRVGGGTKWSIALPVPHRDGTAAAAPMSSAAPLPVDSGVP